MPSNDAELAQRPVVPEAVYDSPATHINTKNQVSSAVEAAELVSASEHDTQAPKTEFNAKVSKGTLDASLHPSKCIVIFVNPTSGGNAAASFIEPGIKELCFTQPDDVRLWLYDIREGPSGNKPGFLKLKSLVNQLKTQQNETLGSEQVAETTHQSCSVAPCIYVIAAGGDGTVMWMVSQIWAHHIDDSYVAVGVVPYGTGNDFARTFGWQKLNAFKPFEAKFRRLRRLICEWLSARMVWHDIWDVSIQSYPGGTFEKIDSNSRSKKLVSGVRPIAATRPSTSSCQETLAGERLTFKMCNYFSMGIESRIGIGFERYRTRNPFCNRFRYAVEGLKKAFFKKPLRIDAMLQDMIIQSDAGDSTTIFSHSPESKKKLRTTGSIIATNIPSFAAGMDVWKGARQWALTSPVDKLLMREPEQLGDGILEFTAFKGIFDMGLERAIKGRGMRVARGKGPFRITLKPPEQPKLNAGDRIYFQVDGEFFVATRLQEINIKWSRRIRVLSSLDAVLDSVTLVDAQNVNPIALSKQNSFAKPPEST